ncbi:MAG: recombinase family protein [Metallibacterium sp.]
MAGNDAKGIRAALYLRVSTTGQDTARQRTELLEVAGRRGWSVEVFEDAGVSGAKGRAQRPGLDAMLREVTRGRFDVVAAWSVDRLGRSLPDLIATMREVQAAGATMYLHQQGLDSSTPAGQAMFGMLGVFAEFERAIIAERVRSGLQQAKARGVKLGRPAAPGVTSERIRELRAQGLGIHAIRKQLGCGAGLVQRVVAATAAAA